MKKKGSTRVKIYVSIVLVIILLSGFIYFILYSDFFKISKLEVEHSIFYNRADFINDLRKEIVSSKKFLGLLDKKSILFWYFAGNQIENPKNFPSLKLINIDSNLAGKSVSISVLGNDLKGVICKSESECFGFNDNGVLYTDAPYVEGSLILKINDLSERTLVLGQPFLPNNEWSSRMFEIISTLKKEGIGVKSAYIEKLDLKEWGVNLYAGPDMYFNFDFIPEKLDQVVTSFFERLDNGNLEYIDFRVPGRIYYK